MGIEAQVAPVAKPFEGARVAFDGILADVSSKSALSLSHSELEAMLFAADNSLMLFADAREAVQQITTALKEAIAA